MPDFQIHHHIYVSQNCILCIFQQLDYPIAAGSKGLITFLNHLTSEMQQCYREKLFGVSKQDLLDVTARFVIIALIVSFVV